MERVHVSAESKTETTKYSPYKLLKHPERVLAWCEGQIAYPISVNIHLTNKCNNYCPRCVTRQRDNSSTMDFDKFKDIVLQLSDVKARACSLGGGGDPTCHPKLAEALEFIQQNGIEAALSTNGYELSDKVIESAVNNCTWIRVSLDADSPRIYRRTHNMDEHAFYQVLDNIKKIVSSKKRNNRNVLIELPYLIGNNTIEGAYNATKLAKELGVDSIRLRPFFNFTGEPLKDEDAEHITQELRRCKELADKNFSVSYPDYRCESLAEKQQRAYVECYSHHFATTITPDCKVYPCCYLSDNPKYCLGDLNKKTFKEIWASEERKKSCQNIDFKDCPSQCSFENSNELLWALKHNKLVGKLTIKEIVQSMSEQIPHSNFF